MGREGRGKAFADYELAKEGLDQPEEHKWTHSTPREITEIAVLDRNGGQCEASTIDPSPNPVRSTARPPPILALVDATKDMVSRCCSMQTFSFLLGGVASLWSIAGQRPLA